MKEPTTDFQAAKAIERIVIQRLIARAKATPHMPNCDRRGQAPCDCPVSPIGLVNWLEAQL